jgi:hypothetical protein
MFSADYREAINNLLGRIFVCCRAKSSSTVQPIQIKFRRQQQKQMAALQNENN